MNANFAASLAAVLESEGGYVNHPLDKGGATNRGITQTTYDDWRHSCSLPDADVRTISDEECAAIYRQRYWNGVHADELPSGVDYATFDLAVNSGVNRACRFLQRAVGAVEDGIIGPKTLAAVKALPPLTVVNTLCDERLAYLRSLPNYGTFGKGWTNRVADVRATASGMAS